MLVDILTTIAIGVMFAGGGTFTMYAYIHEKNKTKMGEPLSDTDKWILIYQTIIYFMAGTFAYWNW